MPLTFVGLGLNDASDITLKAIAAMKAADRIYAEFYTMPIPALDLAELEALSGKKIIVLDRKGVEEDVAFLEEAKSQSIVFLTGGDTMCATTHVELRLRAERKGIQTRIIHNASILTAAAGLAGLQHYKFGRVTTIPLPEGNYFPTSPYDVIVRNLKAGMHTLVLLDTRLEHASSTYMTANQALDILLRMEEKQGEKMLAGDKKLCVIARAGSDDPTVKYGTVAQLGDLDFGEPLHCIIVPGKLHFMEEEALDQFGGLD